MAVRTDRTSERNPQFIKTMRRIIDGHIHVTKELISILRESKIACIANADSPKEYAMLKTADVPEMIVSAGIHPWKADSTDWKTMEPILREVRVIGEIGLDSEWCNVDMEIQRKIFRRQLELAVQLKKPVILHTKGMEREILDIIKEFPNRYLVHWYSCADYLSAYISLGCWFTVGPSVRSDKNVEAVAQNVPINRLLIESDGIEGISWGQNRKVQEWNYRKCMQEHLGAVAEIRRCESQKLLRKMKWNLDEFVDN